jgi:hypothetical protein
MKLANLEKYEKCVYICTSFLGRNGRPFLKVFDTLVFLSLSPPSRLPTSLFQPQRKPFLPPHPPNFVSFNLEIAYCLAQGVIFGRPHRSHLIFGPRFFFLRPKMCVFVVSIGNNLNRVINH